MATSNNIIMRLYASVMGILKQPFYQVAAIIFLFEAAFVPKVSQIADTDAYCHWANYIIAHGIGNIYSIQDPVCNYPPFLCYILFLYAKLVHLNGCQYFRFFKLVGLFADFTVAILLIKMLRNKAKEIVFLLLLVANPVFIYNSYCWGQVDGILTLFIFLSFLFTMRKNILWSAFFFTIALNFKVHAIIFLPPLLLLGYNMLSGEIKVKDIVLSALVLVGTEAFILLPFIMAGQTSSAIKSFTGSVDFYQFISFNAYNFWVLFLGMTGTRIDKEKWLRITLQQWGLLMFFVASAIALFPLLVACISKFLKKNIYTPDLSSIFIVFALIPLVFFYFNTQMHERFGHSCMIFIAAFAFSTRKYWLFLLVCIAYFGNMENVMHFFDFSNYDLIIFTPHQISRVYLFVMLCLIYFLYKPFIAQLKTNRYATQKSE